MLKSVDFPHPLGPIRQINFPSSITRSVFLNAGKFFPSVLKILVISLISRFLSESLIFSSKKLNCEKKASDKDNEHQNSKLCMTLFRHLPCGNFPNNFQNYFFYNSIRALLRQIYLVQIILDFVFKSKNTYRVAGLWIIILENLRNFYSKTGLKSLFDFYFQHIVVQCILSQSF